MPTYEYRCKACGEELEVLQSFTDAPLTSCASCGGELRKIFGNVGIVFKGSGFYKTDSRGSNGKPGAEKTTSEASSSTSGDSPSTSAPSKDAPSKDTSSSSSPAPAASAAPAAAAS